MTAQPNHEDGLPRSVEEYLATPLGPGEGPYQSRNRSLYEAANQCRDIGMPFTDCVTLLSRRASADGLGDPEIHRTIASSYGGTRREPPKGKTWATFKLKRASNPTPTQPIQPRKLPEAMDDGFRHQLLTCFEEGEYVSITDTKEVVDVNEDGEEETRRIPGKGVTLTREKWLENLDRKGEFTKIFSSKHGTYMRINPMSKGGSKDGDVTALRHVLVEFDKDAEGNPIMKDAQYAAIMASGFPISVVLDSGGKSIHAWVKVDAETREQYDERRDIVYDHFAEQFHPVDSQNKNPSRYSRVAGGRRTVEGEWGDEVTPQELVNMEVGPASWAEWERENGVDATVRRDAVWYFENYERLRDERPGTLLGDHWCFRGGWNAIIGPTGQGKTSITGQMGVCWTVARRSFGIDPIAPLRVMWVQVENDETDLGEIFHGIYTELDFTPEEIQQSRENTLVITPVKPGVDTLVELEADVHEFRPDLLILDSLYKWTPRGFCDPDGLHESIDRTLIPMAKRHSFGVLVSHHMGRSEVLRLDGGEGTRMSNLYAGSGGQFVADNARGTLLLEPLPEEGEYALHAAKRASRIGWRTPDGDRVTQKFIGWTEGHIAWREISGRKVADARDARKLQEAEAKRAKESEHIRWAFDNTTPDEDGWVEKADLMAAARAPGGPIPGGIKDTKSKQVIEDMIQEEVLEPTTRKNANNRNATFYRLL